MVGGGIVGVATALTLLERRPGASLILVEKENELAVHQTGHNSGVIHAGVYYEPNSLKARLCRLGAGWTKRFCRENGISFSEPGKLIVATNEAELALLSALEARAIGNALTPTRLDAPALARREPHIRGVGAMHVAETGIVDYREVAEAMAARVRGLGGEIRMATRLLAIDERVDSVTVETGAGAVRADRVVACAGIQADRVARMAGVGDGFAMVPFRGEYFRLPTERSGLISSLIYPVPDPSMPFLGVHLTMMVDGGITVGPNAVLGLAREGYRPRSVDPGDAVELLRFPGFWRLARRLVGTGLAEQRDSLFKRGYLARVHKYCPELTLADLLPHKAGIRAQAVLADGTMVEDFLFRSTPRQLHVINAPSPAATSAKPIAEEICDRLLR